MCLKVHHDNLGPLQVPRDQIQGIVLWTHWWVLVATVVTFPSEDPMSNQVPFGQLSWLVVVGYFVWWAVSFVVRVPRPMMRSRMSPRKSQMNLLGSICPVDVPHLVLHEHESLDLVSGNPRRSQVVVVNFQTHPLVVVRRLAYEWQSFLQRQSE